MRSPTPAHTRTADTEIGLHTDTVVPWPPNYDEPPASLSRHADGESQTPTGKPTQGTQHSNSTAVHTKNGSREQNHAPFRGDLIQSSSA